MNTRLTLSSALAAALFALVPAHAQAPGAGRNSQTRQNLQAAQRLETRIATMQAQIDELQAQVKQLQQQLIQARSLAGLPNAGVSPFYRVPSTPLPNLTLPNSNGQGKFFPPTIQVLPVTPPSSRYNSIPNYTATFIAQPAH